MGWTAIAHYHQLLGSKQQSFWSGHILESVRDSRVQWKTLSGLMFLPVTRMTCVEFLEHLKCKVDAICTSTARAPLLMAGRTCMQPLHYSRCGMTAVDLLPTWLVKALGTTMMVLVVKLVNTLLDSAAFLS